MKKIIFACMLLLTAFSIQSQDNQELKDLGFEGTLKPIDGYITWFYDTSKPSSSLSDNQVLQGVKKAFEALTGTQDEAPQDFKPMGKIRFKQVFSTEDAQIVFGFWKNGQQGLPEQAEFGPKSIARGMYPPRFNHDGKGLASDIFFNDIHDFTIWNKESNAGTHKYFPVAFMHEVGHNLGLPHSKHPGDFLYKDLNKGIAMYGESEQRLLAAYGSLEGPGGPNLFNGQEYRPDEEIEGEHHNQEEIDLLEFELGFLNELLKDAQAEKENQERKHEEKIKEIEDLAQEAKMIFEVMDQEIVGINKDIAEIEAEINKLKEEKEPEEEEQEDKSTVLVLEDNYVLYGQKNFRKPLIVQYPFELTKNTRMIHEKSGTKVIVYYAGAVSGSVSRKVYIQRQGDLSKKVTISKGDTFKII